MTPTPDKAQALKQLADEYARHASWCGYYSDGSTAKKNAEEQSLAARDALDAAIDAACAPVPQGARDRIDEERLKRLDFLAHRDTGCRTGSWGHMLAFARAIEAELRSPVIEAGAETREPVAKSLSASVADALRPYLGDGERVIWQEPFRWHDDSGLLPNHFECVSLQGLAMDFGYEVVHDCGCAGIIRATKATPKTEQGEQG